ncbi:hypothetical protein RFI_34670 [Reticulomyxa filosa]|uniref:Uncharacterized protein n=1 Tax=Reticulomyxa filosa TaxID=46433 RepID=X6LLB1_RETFI|nr:hypothetical protein RFI_34670 [Reticulomyxa filosa]|eukprot:ETO02743.1 hypothetical protein RFI_34670 [Reticulomyxa filosa]
MHHIVLFNRSIVKSRIHSINEIEKNTKLKAWLQHCTSNEYYSIIMTSLPNAMCEYLNNPRMLNVIGFQSQDIQNYINSYFKNNNESNILMKKLNNNRILKLLGHTPLYLRLFCYLSRQNKSNNDKWDEMTLSKLYEILLKTKWIE